MTCTITWQTGYCIKSLFRKLLGYVDFMLIFGWEPAWMALQSGQLEEIPDEMVAKLHDRYTNIYGQK